MTPYAGDLISITIAGKKPTRVLPATQVPTVCLNSSRSVRYLFFYDKSSGLMHKKLKIRNSKLVLKARAPEPRQQR